MAKQDAPRNCPPNPNSSISKTVRQVLYFDYPLFNLIVQIVKLYEYLFLQSLPEELPQQHQEEAERDVVKANGHTESAKKNGFGKIEALTSGSRSIASAQHLGGSSAL